DSLPKCLVLKRWSKSAKCELWGETSGQRTVGDDTIYRSWIGALLQHCKRFARVACFTEGDFKHYSELVVQETAKMESKHGIVSNVAAGTSQPSEDGVRDPIGRRKCSTCGVAGHRRTRCPNGPPTSANSTQEACDDTVPGSTSEGPAVSNANVANADAVGFVAGPGVRP
ncbi:hypothetical protein PIB30_061661, partial [Stylosanthes scabra]|nr:hypothetical protein [Stylosanthes scabra]